MVYGFMRQSGGGVSAENVPDRGARFSLLFPRARGVVDIDTVQSPQTRGEGERLLMVEDQPQVPVHSRPTSRGYRACPPSISSTSIDGDQARIRARS